MRRIVVSLVAALALCGGVTGLLIATNARAAQSAHPIILALTMPGQAAAVSRPVMLAMTQTPGMAAEDRAAPRPDGGSDMMMARGRGQMCKNMYARKVGELAFLEAKLSLTPAQAPLFARWKQVSLDSARRHQQLCADHPARKAGARPTILDRLTMQETLLKTRLADIQAERPALAALYAALKPEQQAELGQAGRRGMAGRMRMMGEMRGHQGPMGRGPDGAPPPPQ